MSERVFNKVLAANRGEIAVRIFRACYDLGIHTVAMYSKEDELSMFRTRADEAYLVGENKSPLGAYLDIPEIIDLAKRRGVDAIHPGYGFLSENADFARACEEAGITFIGPPSDVLGKMGDKLSAKQIAMECGVPVIPGCSEPLRDGQEALEKAISFGFPVILKAAAGGGGRGMRLCEMPEDVIPAFELVKSEARKAFGNDDIFIEKYLVQPKHIEVQILADQYGNVRHLGERDCSLQRRYQKVVEFAPAWSVPESIREQLHADAVKIAEAVGYVNAGTVEFLVDRDGNHYFIEMNPRIQVEHTVTEMVTNIDLVRAQILIAEGQPISHPEIGLGNQDDLKVNGYAIQCRVTTEDPANNFAPDNGKIEAYRSGGGFGVRLDGGNVGTGSVISPYYDSLLVKVTSWDCTFPAVCRKATRAINEEHVRGVKTNIPFVTNILTHPTFVAGKCHTKFIDETPELFEFTESRDRATRVLKYIANIQVNNPDAERHQYDTPRFPKAQREISKQDGLKLLLDTDGPEAVKDWVLGQKKLLITDTTMRDAHQSLLSTRLRTRDMLKGADGTADILADCFSLEMWGGATFDTAYRFLKESPWKRLEILSERMPNTLIQMLLRASNAVGYSNYPDNLVKEFIRISAIKGIDVFRIFDSLNWIENMKMPIEEALKTGKIVEGSLCYTGDILSPNEVKYTLDYYVEKAKELESLGVHILAIKDMAGLLKPYAAQKLVETLKSELHIPIHLHTHDTTGAGVATVLKAAEAGVDIADLAIESMSSCTSQPSLNVVVEALRGTERDTGLDFEGLDELSRYYEHVRKVYKANESGMVSPNAQIYKYEIPGGQYSNLLAQVTEMGSKDEFEKIKELYRQANDLLGNLIKVTPTSKVVGDLAIFMLKNGLNKDNILTEGASLSYPDSVIDFFKGMIGQPEGGFPKELQKIVLKDIEPITVRPGTLLPDVDFEEIKQHLREKFNMEGFSDFEMEQKAVSYALYPKVYEDYCTHFEAYNDVTTLESHVYFYGLRKGEETVLKVSEGRSILIKFVGMSDPDKDGYRTLTFEVNGILREQKVLDKTLEVLEDRKLKADKNNPCHLGSTIPGTVETVLVKEGDEVKVNQPLMIVEAMKMETTFVSKVNGKVDKLYVAPGDRVNTEDLLISFVLDEEEEK